MAIKGGAAIAIVAGAGALIFLAAA
ncbi:hypothetical protein LCGC14_1156200, partial [marine sediment metagenome]